MDFAFTPANGPPRLIRYVERGTLPGANLLSIFNEKENLLIIDKDHYESLGATERHMALRTRQSFTEMPFSSHAPRLAA